MSVNTVTHPFFFVSAQLIENVATSSQLFQTFVDFGLLFLHFRWDWGVVSMKALVDINRIVHHVGRP